MSISHVILATMVAFGASAPALAAHGDAAREDALVTVARPLTYSVQDDRQAAVTYLDDALTLMQMASTHLSQGESELARNELLSASGKLTTAHLLMFKDRAFSRDIAPLSIRAEEAYQTAFRDAGKARSLVQDVHRDLRPLYQAQVARLGGGAGRALEDLDQIKQ